MLEKVKYLLGADQVGPVFIIGTGRSGTHWLGYSLQNHPEIRCTIEEKPMFGLSTRMALNPDLEERLYPRLVRAYKREQFRSIPRLYVDKTHPNIWLAEKLKSSFRGALFVGIERDPYATVASMLKHNGVLKWQKQWRQYPVPNRFLGISGEMAGNYDNIPQAAQSATRWLVHHERMNTLRQTLGEALMVISYEVFAHHTEDVIRELQKFLGLNTPIPVPEVKVEALEKWKKQLTAEQIEQIQRVVGFPPA